MFTNCASKILTNVLLVLVSIWEFVKTALDIMNASAILDTRVSIAKYVSLVVASKEQAASVTTIYPLHSANNSCTIRASDNAGPFTGNASSTDYSR